MADDFQHDVLLNQNAKDNVSVRRLAARLRAVSLLEWFDEWEIQSGG
jgi:hypothetical protein